jgi:hypothetical protein
LMYNITDLPFVFGGSSFEQGYADEWHKRFPFWFVP